MTLPGINFPMDDDAIEKLEELRDNQIMYVQLVSDCLLNIHVLWSFLLFLKETQFWRMLVIFLSRKFKDILLASPLLKNIKYYFSIKSCG